tara:strand:- start:1432 stop:1788 length:357 start_codon:yes stop_codon:yes gene_type:complete
MKLNIFITALVAVIFIGGLAHAFMFPTTLTLPTICFSTVAESIQHHRDRGEYPLMKALSNPTDIPRGGAILFVNPDPDKPSWSFVSYKIRESQEMACVLAHGSEIEIQDYSGKDKLEL